MRAGGVPENPGFVAAAGAPGFHGTVRRPRRPCYVHRMILVLAGIVLVALKLLEVDPVAAWSWWWILSPLVLAFLWFEVFEKTFGFHRKSDQEASVDEKRRRDRVDSTFGLDPKRHKRR